MKKNILIGAALFGAVALCGVAVKKAIKDFKSAAETKKEQE